MEAVSLEHRARWWMPLVVGCGRPHSEGHQHVPGCRRPARPHQLALRPPARDARPARIYERRKCRSSGRSRHCCMPAMICWCCCMKTPQLAGCVEAGRGRGRTRRCSESPRGPEAPRPGTACQVRSVISAVITPCLTKSVKWGASPPAGWRAAGENKAFLAAPRLWLTYNTTSWECRQQPRG